MRLFRICHLKPVFVCAFEIILGQLNGLFITVVNGYPEHRFPTTGMRSGNVA